MRSDGIEARTKQSKGDPAAAELGLSGAPGAVSARVRRNIRRWTAKMAWNAFRGHGQSSTERAALHLGRVMFLRDCLGTEIVKSPRKVRKKIEKMGFEKPL